MVFTIVVFILIDIECTGGFLEHVRLQPQSLAKLHKQGRIQDALASVQYEYETCGYEKIRVKVIDVFGVDTSIVIEMKV